MPSTKTAATKTPEAKKRTKRDESSARTRTNRGWHDNQIARIAPKGQQVLDCTCQWITARFPAQSRHPRAVTSTSQPTLLHPIRAPNAQPLRVLLPTSPKHTARTCAVRLLSNPHSASASLGHVTNLSQSLVSSHACLEHVLRPAPQGHPLVAHLGTRSECRWPSHLLLRLQAGSCHSHRGTRAQKFTIAITDTPTQIRSYLEEVQGEDWMFCMLLKVHVDSPTVESHLQPTHPHRHGVIPPPCSQARPHPPATPRVESNMPQPPAITCHGAPQTHPE